MPSRGSTHMVVKLSRALVHRLRAHADAWFLTYTSGRRAPAPADDGSYSVEMIVTVLLSRDQKHRARSRRPRKVKPYLG
jgi:hypothetical protein